MLPSPAGPGYMSAMANVPISTSAPETERWYQGCSFTADWTSRSFPLWMKILGATQDAYINVLEIGSWEGRSALFFLNYLPKCRLVCVDTFAGGQDHRNDPQYALVLPDIEKRFDANLVSFKSRVEKIKATSSEALASLAIAKRRFDLAFIDGSHQAKDVYSDAALTWPLLNNNAILILDDYEWHVASDEADRPKSGINAFLCAFADQYSIMHRGYQVILRKS